MRTMRIVELETFDFYLIGDKAPVILDNNFVSSRNKKYKPIKISLTK